jgi:hypothetical protein
MMTMPKKKNRLVSMLDIFSCASGMSSIKEIYSMAPEESPKQKMRYEFLNFLTVNKMRLPIHVDRPAKQVKRNGMVISFVRFVLITKSSGHWNHCSLILRRCHKRLYFARYFVEFVLEYRGVDSGEFFVF